jgi:hypothetical protein
MICTTDCPNQEIIFTGQNMNHSSYGPNVEIGCNCLERKIIF